MKLTHKFSYASTLLVFLFGSFSYAKLETPDCVKERNNNDVEVNSPKIEELKALREQQQEKFEQMQYEINKARSTKNSSEERMMIDEKQKKLNKERKEFYTKLGKKMIAVKIIAMEKKLKNEKITEDSRRQLTDQLNGLYHAQKGMQNNNNDQ